MAKKAAKQETEGAPLHEAELDLQAKALDDEVRLANRKPSDAPAKPAAARGPLKRWAGPDEPPSGRNPNAGKVPDEVKEALSRAMPVSILNEHWGLVFTFDGNQLFYLDQINPGTYVLRQAWNNV